MMRSYNQMDDKKWQMFTYISALCSQCYASCNFFSASVVNPSLTSVCLYNERMTISGDKMTLNKFVILTIYIRRKLWIASKSSCCMKTLIIIVSHRVSFILNCTPADAGAGIYIYSGVALASVLGLDCHDEHMQLPCSELFVAFA